MGWGDIAHKLGLHPSVLGMGHTKKTQAMEQERNIKASDGSQDNSNNGKNSPKASKSNKNSSSGSSHSKGKSN